MITASPLMANILGGKAETLETGIHLLNTLKIRAQNPELLGRGKDSRHSLSRTTKDCIQILQLGRRAILIVLNEVRVIVEQQIHSSLSKSQRNKAFALERKLFFLLVWANERDLQAWEEVNKCCENHEVHFNSSSGPVFDLPWKSGSAITQPVMPNSGSPIVEL